MELRDIRNNLLRLNWNWTALTPNCGEKKKQLYAN